MRGTLQIRSARTPYLRGGLNFATREPLQVDIRDLDGARLLELARDPVLSIAMGDEDGSFRPMPAVDQSVGVDQAQMMIDSLAAELPERIVPSTDPVADELSAIAVKLREAGFADLDALLEAFTILFEQHVGDVDALKAAGFDDLEPLLQRHRDIVKELSASQDKVTELTKEVAQLKASAAKPAPKPKTPAAEK